MTSRMEARMAVARGAIAASVADRIEVPLAGTQEPGEDLSDRTYFTLCSSMPAGYHMETELLPLEAIMRDVEMVVRSEDEEEDRPVSSADHRLEEINAFVHDRLLNPALPLRPVTPSVTALQPINEIYGETLRRAVFAGDVAAGSSRYEEASALLFADGAPTEALETYRDYEKRVQDARAALNELEGPDREDAQRRLDRLEAEWIGIGKRREIEEAFRILQEESESAGFEDERNRLLERFQAGEKARIDAAGLSFFKVNLVPISPLFSDESGPHWQKVELDAEGVESMLTAPVQVALDVPNEAVSLGLEGLDRLSYEYVQCDIVRDWLDSDFFTERFWRLGADDEPLSDGKGSGRLPTLPVRVVFIRDARAIYEGETRVVFGDEAEVVESAMKTMATLQVLPDTDDEDDDADGDEPELIEAAERAGLSASVNLLRRESERASKVAGSRVMTVAREQVQAAAPSQVAEADENAGNNGGEDGGGGSSFLKSAIKGISNIVSTAREVSRKAEAETPGERAASARPASSARVSVSERRPRRRSGKVVVRDHRTDRSDRDGRRRRDRDESGRRHHRARGRRGRPSGRSSRSRDRTTVRASRGSSARSRTVTLRGEITAREGQAERLAGLSLAFIGPGDDDSETSVDLDRSSSSRLTFSRRVRDQRRKRGQSKDERWFEFVLRDGEDNELDRQLVTADDDESDLELAWTVGAEPVSIELAGSFTPTLHGYQLRVVPPSPNPDESLSWGEGE